MNRNVESHFALNPTGLDIRFAESGSMIPLIHDGATKVRSNSCIRSIAYSGTYFHAGVLLLFLSKHTSYGIENFTM